MESVYHAELLYFLSAYFVISLSRDILSTCVTPFNPSSYADFISFIYVIVAYCT